MYDLIIIGGGPAGLSAGVYAARAMLNTVIIEKQPINGGQVLNTYEVDNYLGIPDIDGFNLAKKFKEHAEKLGAEFLKGEVKEIVDNGDFKEVILKNNDKIETKTIIVATGTFYRKLNIDGEERLRGMGVSYCATCDGSFFRNKVTAVVGGGDVALEDAVFLSRICKKVYIIHRRDKFRGAKILQEKVESIKNIEILYNTITEKINGKNEVEGLLIKNINTEETFDISVNGVFIAIGTVPDTGFLKGLIELDNNGYVIAGEDGVTSKNGIFAAGDIRLKALRQIITAASDGANCVYSVEKYIEKI